MYYASFFIIYAGKIESVRIDKKVNKLNNWKKKGIIKYELVNVFLSKIEKSFKIDEMTDMEILYKGKIRRDGDYTRYYIRLSFKENESLVFGECLTLRKAAEKVK